ncbi:hypothetical protein KAU45_06255 [bacterium]|nr:hypothetical protein [bacterium]
MKPGTGLSLLIPLLLMSILLGTGCIMPGAPDGDPPDTDTPLGLLEAFEWYYNHQDQELYAEILDPDFVYILFPDQGYFDEDETPVEWGREEELARFADLCDACDEGDIDLDLDLSGYESPGPDDDEWLIPNVEYILRVVLEDTIYQASYRADFHTVKTGEGYPRWRLLELRGFERPELHY